MIKRSNIRQRIWVPKQGLRNLRHNWSFHFPISSFPLPTSPFYPPSFTIHPFSFSPSISLSPPNSFPHSPPCSAPRFPIFLPFPVPALSPSPSLPLLSPKFSQGVWGNAVSSPSGVRGRAHPKSNFVHFSRKIWHQVTTISATFTGNCLPYLVLFI